MKGKTLRLNAMLRAVNSASKTLSDGKRAGRSIHTAHGNCHLLTRIDHRGEKKLTFNIHNVDIDINEYDIRNENILIECKERLKISSSLYLI